ncbi:MAG: hypothetical protein IRZ21_02665 [Thermoleophilaceae bacterium]|nr:hypothetical protein [Thermoleophilaceae bacterium]
MLTTLLIAAAAYLAFVVLVVCLCAMAKRGDAVLAAQLRASRALDPERARRFGGRPRRGGGRFPREREPPRSRDLRRS